MSKEETKFVFKDGVNYEVKSVDRPYTWRINKKDVIYVDFEEFKFLRQMYYYNELDKEHNRCYVEGVNGKLIRCPRSNICEECSRYYDGNTNKSDISMDASYEDGNAKEYADPSYDPLEIILKEEKINAVYKAVSEIKDEISRFLIETFCEDTDLTDEALTKIVNERFNTTLGRRAISKRKKKELDIIRDKVRFYFDR